MNNNWWTDPANKEAVDRLSWWNHEENQHIFHLPIAVIKDGDYYVACLSDATKKYLGDVSAVAHGMTKEEAIKRMFEMVRLNYEYSKACGLEYQRWVPLRVGPWERTGGKWISVFGIHVYFRYGKNMKGGFYIPFTKLNISFSNDWLLYRKWERGLL